MFEYIVGKTIELTPVNTVIEADGIGYFVHISLYTSSKLRQSSGECKLYIHQVIREDSHQFYGFIDKEERELFRFLISVSGIGANTARMMLSSLVPKEIRTAILQGKVDLLKSIKGIGQKTAQRIIIDLRDKLGKETDDTGFLTNEDNTVRDESLSALVNLGFAKPAVEKTLSKIITANPELSAEEVVKIALKQL